MRVVVWEALGAAPPLTLAPERLVLHHAAQLVAAVGRSLVPPRPDDGHTSLEWVAGALVGQEVAGPRPWAAALRPSDLSLVVVAAGVEAGRLALAVRTRDEAFEWLRGIAEGLGVPSGRLKFDAPYKIPDHPIAAGAPFPAPTRNTAELARWFADGSALLRGIASQQPDAAPVRVWPHHFDAGSVLPLGAPYRGESPSIGIGLSPGDEGIAEPYFYATLWPGPDPDSLPPLPAGGRWQREGWTGAVLTGSEIVAAGDGAGQAAAASAFLTSAIEVLRDHHARRA
jgi:hypothetical protein